MVDAASGNPSLSHEFSADRWQDKPCILDNKDHLAAIASREPNSGLTFLPIALADLRTLIPSQCTRLSTGLRRLAADYDVVVIDGCALDEDTAVAAIRALATSVVVVRPAACGSKTDDRDMAERLDIAPERMAGHITMATSDMRTT